MAPLFFYPSKLLTVNELRESYSTTNVIFMLPWPIPQ